MRRIEFYVWLFVCRYKPSIHSSGYLGYTLCRCSAAAAASTRTNIYIYSILCVLCTLMCVICSSLFKYYTFFALLALTPCIKLKFIRRKYLTACFCYFTLPACLAVLYVLALLCYVLILLLLLFFLLHLYIYMYFSILLLLLSCTQHSLCTHIKIYPILFIHICQRWP